LTQPAPLAQIDHVRHAFCGRQGGVSEGIFASLNCGFGSGDDPAKVAENRARAGARAGVDPKGIVTAFQTHSVRVALVEQPWMREEAPKVDAMVTRKPGIALGILSADCAPVLFADPTARVIGAAHAGWRGAFDGVIEATIAAMCEQGAEVERLSAAIGPCIAQPSYEVGPEFRQRLHDADAGNERFFRPSAARPGHFHFDLPGYVAHRLSAAGIRQIAESGHDTCAEAETFFSYRRNTLQGQKGYGRNISLIALEG
jgi:YfiH family protein